MPWQSLRESVIQRQAYDRQTHVETLWFSGADRSEMKRLGKLRFSIRRSHGDKRPALAN